MSEDYALLDVRGYRCPIPVIRTEAALRRAAPGDRVKVIADDPVAAVDIPHYCREAGHRVERLPAAAVLAENTTRNGGKPRFEAPEQAEPAPSLCVFLVTRGENP